MDNMTETSSHKTRFLLTNSNYVIWKISIEAKLFDLGAREYVVGITKVDEKTSAEEIAKLSKLNTKAYSLIIQNLDSENLSLVSTTLPITDQFNGKALWTLLRNKYAGSNLAARSAALDIFLDLEFKDVSLFATAIRLSNQKMVLAGIMLDDQVKMMIMLQKLPRQEFRSFRDIVAMGFATESFEAIVKRLEAYTVTNNIKKDSLDEPQVSPQTSLHTQSVDSSLRSNPVCPHCKKVGHRPNNCWLKFPEKAPNTKRSHMTTDSQLSSNPTDFTWFRTAEGVRHHVDEIKFENVTYFR
ncbi:uncharacterized protein PGTG_19015 [Puccinia graminis f. sp. tritici CRL 75-36-700-3]|uniref:DUF4219 domain-containing protein n=1 Tax=Puccinia graminis f. sp. tritici (strain CRL 75-36-700-3 / race SCCL) TaxID=418459 RepID=E3L8X7_PUCGT|nr:uncharacterized protein PGTG_19015 [Puccinia graminis f. sp. tritici CRL 75-36-700-3]EFP93002.1 hypothetical protein PGTG_19015 [Puccinia graminis f. sp. tritici CRL 75-36-700-3]